MAKPPSNNRQGRRPQGAGAGGGPRNNSSSFASRQNKNKSKANAEAGFAKRQSLKEAKRKANDDQNVYEYLPEDKVRRSKIKLDLDKDEALEFGSIDDIDDAAREALRARLIGENDDDERVQTDDDEEVDSDAAFEESDNERFAEFFGKKNKKGSSSKKDRAVRFADVDLNEDLDNDESPSKSHAAQDSDEEELDSEAEGEDDEFIDLLDVLDGKGDIDMPTDDESSPATSAAPPSHEPSSSKPSFGDSEDEDEDQDMEEHSASDEEEDDDEEDEDEDEDGPANDIDITASDDEDLNDDTALSTLQNFVSNLETTSQSTQKRKAPTDRDEPAADTTRARKRRTIREKTETGAESEFRIDSSDSKLNLDDLLAPLSTSTSNNSSSLQTLKRTTKILTSSKTKALSAPLPQRAQERLDREAAYEQTKEEVDKWSGTMKKLREAEHLSFPLQAEKPGRASNLELTAKFKPTTQLESAVDSLLKSAKLRDEDLPSTEDGLMLKTNNLTLAEVAERRNELRKMRELMLRAELKASRANKIKSKTYRKLRRKEKERLAAQLGDTVGSADEEEEEEGEEARERRAVERARERATLRHKHTGKWATQMGKKHMDVDQRKELQEMLSKGEKLRRKVQGLRSDEESAEESSDDDEDGDGDVHMGDAEKIKKGAFDELMKLKDAADDEEDDEELEAEKKAKKGKSIFEMKFMKDAMARQQAAANREVDDFLRELGDQEDSDSDDNDEADEEAQKDQSSGLVVHRANGRVVYRPGAPSSKKAATSTSKPSLTIPSSTVVPPPSDTSSVTLRSTDLQSPPLSPDATRAPPNHRTSASTPAEANPWLTPADGASSSKASKKNEVVLSKESKAQEKSKNKLKKQDRKREEERERAKDDAELEISAEAVLTLQGDSSPSPSSLPIAAGASKPGKVSVSAKANGKRPAAAADGGDDDSDSDANSELDAQEAALKAKANKGKAKAGANAFQQRDLVALAFAGDNVVKDFEETKKRAIAEDAPKEIDTTLAGWGSWGGSGLSKKDQKPKRPNPKLIKKIAGVDPTTRADYNKKHIIISEKKDKKAGKYMVKDLPYPYSSQAQYEKAMERPLGVQWNTRTAFQRATLPRVVTKPGVVIAPLDKIVQ